MARKKEEFIPKNIDLTLDDIVSDRFGRYSKYIIQERALPDARDGLKPVQRRILYSMYEEGNTAEKAYRKAAKTVGSIMGNYHPHGDSSIYEALVRLSQDWKVNVPLIDFHGNNGSIDDDPPAAYRYTEVRLDKKASYLLEDIDKNAVTMTNNYDDTLLEPTVLPARYPLLLVNGSTGIASGYATNIPPHNLNEVVSATIHRLNHPDCSLEEVMEYVKGPDFPTGGIVQGKKNIEEVFRTGKGKVVLRSRCEIVESKTGSQIVVSEIPYEVIKSQLVKRISDLYLSKELEGITDVRDESGRSGLRIIIDVKKDVEANQVLNYLYKNTDLQINYSYNCIAIVDHRPKLVSLLDALDVFIAHRREVVLNRTVYLRDKKKDRLHIIEGLIKAVSILDSVIELIRKSKDKKEAKERLCEAFLFTDVQAEAIVNLRLYRLSNTDVTALKQEYGELVRDISFLESILKSEDVLKSVLTKELEEVNKEIVIPRRSTIEDEIEEIVVDKTSMIPNEACYIVVSRDGYLKRFSERAFAANENQLPMTKESDSLIGMKACDTLDTLLLFTSKGNYAYLPVHKIDECRFKDLGKHISAYVKMEGQEKIVGAVVVKNFNTYAFIISVSKNGMIKKSSLPKYDLSRSSKAVPAMKLKAGDELVSATVAYEGDDVLVISRGGFYNRYSVDVLADLAARAQGVGAMQVKNDEIVSAVIIHPDNNELLLTTERGSMKRIHFDAIELTNRNVKGNRLFKQTKTNPNYILTATTAGTFTTLIFDDGEVKILDAKEIPFMEPDATFSMPIDLHTPYVYIKKDLTDIPSVEIIDFPASYDRSEENVEQTNLFE